MIEQKEQDQEQEQVTLDIQSSFIGVSSAVTPGNEE